VHAVVRDYSGAGARNVSCKRFTQVAVVVAFLYSVHALANDCAAGMDATGNACNGDMAARTISAVESNLLYLKGAAMMASLRSMQAKQRQIDADAEVKSAEAALKTSLKALSDAEKSAAH
jgi:hypothetical protein